MQKVKIVDTGVISRNHNPGYEYFFACHSHLAQLSNNELLCTFQSGQALYSTDSVMKQARSTDGGKTWNSEGLIYDPVNDKRPYSYHAPQEFCLLRRFYFSQQTMELTGQDRRC